MAVAWGIIRESERFWSLTTLLVVVGVAVEAICTILLFGFDEGITSALQSTNDVQQSRIIELTARIAPRRIVPAEQEKIAGRLKVFAGQKFEQFPNPGDNESDHLAYDIGTTLVKAGWIADPHGGSILGMAAGVTILSGEPAADALAKELNTISIEARVIAQNSAAGNRMQIQVGAKP